MVNFNKSRIFIPKFTIDTIFYNARVINTSETNIEQVSFRMSIQNNTQLQDVFYSLGGEGWTKIGSRDIAANLYTVEIPPNTNNRLRLRTTTGSDDILILYINLQLSPQVTVEDYSFDPEDISGLHIHYDAKDVVTDGITVSQLTDQTDNKIDAIQSTMSNQPGYIENDPDFNGNPSVYFNDTPHNMQTDNFPEDLEQPNTILMVFKDQSTDPGIHFDGLSNTKRHLFGNINIFIMEAEEIIGGGSSDTATHVTALRFNKADANGYLDGDDIPFVGASGVGDIPLNGLIFGTNNEKNNYKDFKMAEFLLYDRLLSDTEIDELATYLANKYGTSWVPV